MYVVKLDIFVPWQLGEYLKNQQYVITNATLILYSLQICKALAYLEGLNMVHRYEKINRCLYSWHIL